MSDNALTPVARVGRGDVIQLVEAARDYAHAGRSANTRRAYQGAWQSFTSWCASVGADPLPAAAATVALYLTARAPTHAVSTLAIHLAAITAAHRAADRTVPDSADLRSVWAGIRRTHGRPPRKKRALVTEDLRRVVKRTPDSLTGIRDRAVLLIGFAGALRRSELAALALDGHGAHPVRAAFVADGVEIHLDRSKGDQKGRGAIVAVPYGRRAATCPVSALQAWLKAADIKQGHVFRAVSRRGRVGSAPLSDRTIARIVKAGAGRAGFDAASFAGHSLRRGGITSASRGGASPAELKAFGRHAKFEQTLGYVEEADRFKTAASGKAGL